MNRRCAEHVGDPFPSRCGACDALNAPRPAVGYFPGTDCARHPGYPLPCDKCQRIAEEATP